MNKDCCPIQQQVRQELIDWLYLQDERDNPSHPNHALYTGLFQAMQDKTND